MGLYRENKSASVGVEVECPVCHGRFVKKYYQQVFCCKDCKERFWNGTRKSNGYFRRYNMSRPERLERIGIDPERYAGLFLGDDECESFAQISLDQSCLYDDYD